MRSYQIGIFIGIYVAFTTIALVIMASAIKPLTDIAWQLHEIRISIDSQTDTVDAIVDEVMTDLDEKLPGWAWGGK